MSLIDFTKRLEKLRNVATRDTIQINNEITDDAISINVLNAGWDRQEIDGRIFITRR